MIIYLLLICLLVIIGIVLVWKFKYEVIIVRGGSMLPTLDDGDLVLIDKMNKKFNLGSIHVLQPPINDYIVIKRLCKIENYNSVIGEKLNRYWFLGDNRDFSQDSRTYGWINKEAIEGRVIKTWKRKRT